MGLQETVFQVRGMDCQGEVNALRTALLSLEGVEGVEPNILTAKVLIQHQSNVSQAELKRRIQSSGLSIEESQKVSSRSYFLNVRFVIIAVSGLCLLSGLMSSHSVGLEKLFFFVSMGTGGILVIPKAIRGLKAFTLDMNVLMTIATIGSIFIGEYAEGAAVVFLFALAEFLEGFSLDRAKNSIQSLLKLVPEKALIKRDNDLQEIPLPDVRVDDIVLIRSGSRIPLDGVVISGQSSVNQASITGESLPLERKVGDRVLAGTVNEEGSIEIRVTHSQKDTKVSQIIRLIEEAQKQKAPTQRFVDTFAKYYTPSVLSIAAGLLLIPPIFFHGEWNSWIYRSLVLIVIACPCALVIATPVSIVSGITAMARRGVLIKGGANLEAIGKLQALAVDKTGTITEGVPRIFHTQLLNGYKLEQVMSVAASIDTHSIHPLAKTVVNYARSKNIHIPSSIGYQATSGRGAEAVIDDHSYFVGNHRFAHDNAVCSDDLEKKLEEIEDQAQSVVIVGHRPHAGCVGEVMGVLGLGDAIRKGAKETIEELHRAGIKRVIMLSGDNPKTVSAIAKQVGIDEAYGDLLPSDKVMKIKEIKNRFGSVAMIGDGVNDAPAMATATLGIAMGASGSDAAIETSDITLMQDQLLGIADAIRMGKKTLKIIWFNTGFALTIKLVFLGLSLTGYSSLWLAIAADTGATLLVIANAVRLLR